MDLADVIRGLNQVEEDHCLFTDPIRDSPIWEYVRGRVWLDAREALVSDIQPELGEEVSGISFRQKLRWLIQGSIDPRLSPLTLRPDTVFVGFGRRQSSYDDMMWDIILDPIVAGFRDTESWGYFEPPLNSSGGNHHPDTKTPDDRFRILDSVSYSPRVAKRIPGFPTKLSEDEKSRLTDIEKGISAELGFDVELKEEMAHRLNIRKAQYPLYKHLLSWWDPDRVVFTNPSGLLPMVEACSSLNIPTIEVQHGTLNRYQPASSFPPSVSPRIVPDHLLAWGEGWVNQDDLPSNVQLHCVGYPYSDREVDSILSDESYCKENEQILILSQFFVGETLASYAITISEELDGIEVIFKPHPAVERRWNELYPELERSSVRVETSQTTDLYELLAASNAQVGVSSTALFEGTRFGLQTFIVDKFTSCYCDSLVERGIADRVSKPEEVIDRYDGQDRDFDTDLFFKPSSVDNIINVIKSIG